MSDNLLVQNRPGLVSSGSQRTPARQVVPPGTGSSALQRVDTFLATQAKQRPVPAPGAQALPGAAMAGILAEAATALLPANHVQEGDAGSFEDLARKHPGNYLFLFNERSGTRIDWSSPSNLARTTAESSIQEMLNLAPSAIGHAQIGWVLNDGHGHVSMGATGQTGELGGQGFKATMQGWGLNVLNTVYLDGQLQSEKDVLDGTKAADKTNNLSWMAIKTDYATCKQAVDFINAYAKSGAARHYGFPPDPLQFQGAGCTSFAAAVFQKSLLGIPIFDASKRDLLLPEKLLGKLTRPVPNTIPPVLAPSTSQQRKVPGLPLLLGKTRWAYESEPHQNFWLYDPELYFESTVEMENAYRQQAGLALKPAARTSTLDPYQARAEQVSGDWVSGLLQQAVPIELGQIHNTTGLIIDLSRQGASAPNS